MKFEALNFEARKRLAIAKLRLRVSRVMPLDSLWQQAFAAALAAPRESSASAFAFHAGTKTVLTFAGAF
jgi:hypothetical protein